jgi:hypothetical protein
MSEIINAQIEEVAETETIKGALSRIGSAIGTTGGDASFPKKAGNITESVTETVVQTGLDVTEAVVRAGIGVVTGTTNAVVKTGKRGLLGALNAIAGFAEKYAAPSNKS